MAARVRVHNRWLVCTFKLSNSKCYATTTNRFIRKIKFSFSLEILEIYTLYFRVFYCLPSHCRSREQDAVWFELPVARECRHCRLVRPPCRLSVVSVALGVVKNTDCVKCDVARMLSIALALSLLILSNATNHTNQTSYSNIKLEADTNTVLNIGKMKKEIRVATRNEELTTTQPSGMLWLYLSFFNPLGDRVIT